MGVSAQSVDGIILAENQRVVGGLSGRVPLFGAVSGLVRPITGVG